MRQTFAIWTTFGLLAASALGHDAHADQGHDSRGEKLASAPPEAQAVLQQIREANGERPTLPLVPTYQSLAGALSADTLMTTLETLTGFGTRYTQTAQYANSAILMRDRFATFGLDSVSLFNFNCCGGVRQNVVGIKYGTTRPNEIVIIGGHLDSISQSPTTNAPGAEDNGTGSVSVYELARLLSNVETERTIHFVLFGGEEQGLIGSEAYAAKADAENWNIVGVITFDMVGYYDPAGADLWVEGFSTGSNSMWLVDLVRQHAQTYADLSVYTYPGNGWGSDHEPFHAHGFPAMLSIENEWDDYSCYHRTCDTIDNITGSFLRKIAAGTGTAALELAIPAFSPASVSGHVDIVGTNDESGVSITLLGTGYEPSLTGADGSYALPTLLPGTYQARAERGGYLAQTFEVELSSGEAAILDFTLVPETTDAEEPVLASGLLTLSPARPNPFAAETDLSFALSRDGSVSLRIVDAQGRNVVTLVDGERSAGSHSVHWDGTTEHGLPAPSGVYWAEVRVEAGLSGSASARTVFVRMR